MAPPKVMLKQNRAQNTFGVMRKGMTTRSQNQNLLNNVLNKQNIVPKETRGKRKAEAPPPQEKITKRTAFGNITNAIGRTLGEQNRIPSKIVPQFKTAIENNAIEKRIAKATIILKSKPPSRVKPIVKKDEEKKSDENKADISQKFVNIRASLDSEKSEENSLYVSALEDVAENVKNSLKFNSKVSSSENVAETEKFIEVVRIEPMTNEGTNEEEEKLLQGVTLLDDIPENKLPEGVLWDFDAENWLDHLQVSTYAMDIFQYLKERESSFVITNYMERQVCLSRWMRAMLVDWMVEVQESFELNHETLYLAVKLVDLYLTKVTVGKETLQLLGAASLFIASKYDERIPPMVDDFLYICDGAYSQRELIRMEMNILKVVNFDLGIPLSYRFLRRYARCAKVSMPTLTLARFILEYSLMDYTVITFSDSKMAAAALLLALQMKDLGGWTPTLEYYSSYRLDDIKNICITLNEGLHKKHKESLMTVRNKYSHKIFFEVAKLPLKDKLDI
ncbi:G2/mitotic-specific cyclin-B3 [Harpegnathos saltator]|uniref:G2/mitotic-specific cyclin-B3 n=1 Tax=Harpegnathos saltator TaxID=610380 RepID=E2C2R2_HARSA|nr:G2/mitotic-specific cyclin-B3 [Harpegnathos saltator]XP_025156955.1 G2/mitotic-specific cyclin-B3 [Harpegnathos saltator]EFN77747.1 G2/mitotic-specific cyclin-B3 [Harpegnathos saltator]